MNRNNEIPDLSDIRLLDIDTGAEWNRFRTAAGIKEPKVFSLSKLWKVAASIILIAGAGLLAYSYMGGPKAETYASADKAMETIVETSTQISLNRNSSITCTDNRNNGEYTVKLQGEAYFDVEKNPARTFMITTQDLTVTVHGTSFNICEQADETTVTVTSGNVEVRSNATNETVANITKGGLVRCHKNGKIEVSEVQNFNSIAWKLRKLEFCDTPMHEIMEQLSKAYDFKYKFADEETANATVTGKFDNQELQPIFTILEQALDLNIERGANGVWTVGK